MTRWTLETSPQFDRAVVAEIRDDVLVIVAIGLGHRSDIYKER